MKFFLDEGAPAGIADTLEEAGFTVIRFHEAASPGDADPIVAQIAMANEAVLVAVDRDMRELAKGAGVSKSRYKTLNLLHFRSKAAIALGRVDEALPYIRLRLDLTTKTKERRLWVEVRDTSVKIIDKV